MLVAPDCISTLELSKLWMYKALKEIDAEFNQPLESDENEDTAAAELETEDLDEA